MADQVRDDRAIYFARDIHQMNLVLGKFLNKSGAETVMLVDEAGHLVARQGVQSPASEDTITALVAGTFSASQSMAGMLGAEEFSSLIPRGGGGHILLLRAGEAALLAVVFDESRSSTVVRTYALEAIRRIDSLLVRAGKASKGKGEEIEGEVFDDEIDGALTDVFG
jgi:predicted regulator of Ras-like GTPase activity (Roadblock/LC7/MglB family)